MWNILLAFQQAIVLMFSGAKGWVFDNPDIQEPWLQGDELPLHYTCEPYVSTHKDSTSLIIAVYVMEITFSEYEFCSDLLMLWMLMIKYSGALGQTHGCQYTGYLPCQVISIHCINYVCSMGLYFPGSWNSAACIISLSIFSCLHHPIVWFQLLVSSNCSVISRARGLWFVKKISDSA